jgi:hypothetical protein
MKNLHEGVVGRHFVTNIITKKKWMQDIGGQLYSRIFMTFAKVVITIRKLKDSKQKVWPNW